MAVFYCKLCLYESECFDSLQAHFKSEAHIDMVCALPKDTVLTCLVCNQYVTNQKCNFRRHMTTCGVVKQIIEKPPVDFVCNVCNKQFQTRSGLFKHKQKCVKNEPPTASPSGNSFSHTHTPDDTVNTSTIVNYLEKRLDNLEQKVLDNIEQKVLEALKTSVMNTTINNIHNGDNHIQNNVNLNVFLNEHCKDAMNIMDFIQGIQLKLKPKDIAEFGVNNYVGTMSKIMIKELEMLPLTQRPLHCTDVRRHTLHVKHEDEWHKECKGTPILMNAIVRLQAICQMEARKNFSMKHNDTHYKLFIQVTGGKNGGDDNIFAARNSKIVSKICSAVRLDKTHPLPLPA